MTTFDALDNPIWESLTSTHANMARSNGSARRYASQVSPLAAVSKPTPTAFSDLAALMKVEEQVGLFTAEPLHVAENGAKILYQKLGFRVRRTLQLTVISPARKVGYQP